MTEICKRSGPARGTSYANSGMIHPSQAQPWIFDGDNVFDQAAFKTVYQLAERSKILLQDKMLALGLFNALRKPAIAIAA